VVLTYQEAEEAGARALAGINGDDPDALCGDKHPEWAHWTDEAAAVLEAVGYADLDLLHQAAAIGAADSVLHLVAMQRTRAEAAEAEVERLHSWAGLMELLDEHWPADIWPMLEDDRKADAGHRVTSAMRWIDQLCAERDALAATVARVKVEGDRCSNSTNYTVQFAGGLLREVLRPRGADDE